MPKTVANVSPDVFPTLHSCLKLANGERLYDVKFYPFGTLDGEQVFAVTGEKDIFVCRINHDADPPFDVLRWFKDLTPDPSYNCLVWTLHPTTRKPLLCVAGHKPKQVQILDLETGAHVRTLVGHGRGINDLAVSPLSTSLLASAAEDYTIRLWNLEAKYEKQPCVGLLAGEGHKMPVLAINFHPNGYWLLSGGIDTAVCLWAVPSLQDLERSEDPIFQDFKTVYCPHFYSTEVHDNYIDCLAFYGDLIISRSANGNARIANEILLWKIDGFDSHAAPSSDPPMPSPGVYTRSSFPHSSTSRGGYQRLLTFSMPSTNRFYNRFSLLHAPGMRPILAMGNEVSKFLFWDLQKLEKGYDPSEEGKGKKGGRGRNPKTEVKWEALKRETSARREKSESSAAASTSEPSVSLSTTAERKYDLGDNFRPLPPHRTIVGNTSLSSHQHFGTSQIAWSPDGTWMIGVGDRGMMCIFHRDESVV